MFSECLSLTNLPNISIWNSSKAQNLRYMFNGFSSLTYLSDISKKSVNNVKNIEGIFTSCSALKSYPNIIKWIKTNTKLKFEDFFEIFNISNVDMKIRLEQGNKNIIGFSLGTHFPIELSAKFIIDKAFRNIYAFSMEANIIFIKINIYVLSQIKKKMMKIQLIL